MAQTLTDRVKAIKNTPGTGENVDVSEINSAFDKFDNHFIPAAKMTRTTTQSISNNTGTKIAYDTVEFDTYASRTEGAMASASNDEFTIRKAGLYRVEAKLNWPGNATGYRSMRIVKNGTTINAMYIVGSSAASQTTHISDTLLLAVNDVIQFHCFQNSGGSLITDTDTYPDMIEGSVIWQGSAVEV
jgi:hypothetical protein